MNSTFLLQGLHMRISLFNDTDDSAKDYSVVPPALLSLADVFFVLVLIPIMDKLIYPWLDRKGWSLSVFTRISIGKFSDYVSVVLTSFALFDVWYLKPLNLCSLTCITDRPITVLCISSLQRILYVFLN